MKILVLGGTRFFGKRLVQELLNKKHEVTILTRGIETPEFENSAFLVRAIADRRKKKELLHTLKGTEWDIVYDNICYSGEEAWDLCEIFNNEAQAKKVVFTSTSSVYEKNGERSENDFDPSRYPFSKLSRDQVSYAEGKRDAEAIYLKKAQFSLAIARLPVVLGLDDYTERLKFHIEKIRNEEPFVVTNLDAKISLMYARDVSHFLRFLGESKFEGPINAASEDAIQLSHIIEMIEHELKGKKALLLTDGDIEISPLSSPHDSFLNVQKLIKIGYKPMLINEWLPKLINLMVS